MLTTIRFPDRDYQVSGITGDTEVIQLKRTCGYVGLIYLTPVLGYHHNRLCARKSPDGRRVVPQTGVQHVIITVKPDTPKADRVKNHPASGHITDTQGGTQCADITLKVSVVETGTLTPAVCPPGISQILTVIAGCSQTPRSQVKPKPGAGVQTPR